MLIINNKNNNFPIEIRDYEAYPIDNERFSFEKKDLRQKSIIKKTNTQTDTQNISNDIEKTEKPKIGISLIKKTNTQTDAQNTPNDIEKTEKPKIGISLIKKINTQTDAQNTPNDIEKTEKPKIGISLIKKINTQTDAQNTPNDIEYQDEIIISTTPNKVIDISGLQKIIEHKMCIDNVVNRDIMNYDW